MIKPLWHRTLMFLLGECVPQKFTALDDFDDYHDAHYINMCDFVYDGKAYLISKDENINQDIVDICIDEGVPDRFYDLVTDACPDIFHHIYEWLTDEPERMKKAVDAESVHKLCLEGECNEEDPTDRYWVIVWKLPDASR